MTRVIYRIPVFGWLLRDAVEGDALSKAFFAFNMLVIWALAIAFFGYPAVILPALAATVAIIGGIVILTFGK